MLSIRSEWDDTAVSLMATWVEAYEPLAWWLAGVSVVTFVASVIAMPFVIVQMPADYFVRPTPTSGSWQARHPAVRVTLLAAKNTLGAMLVVAGIIMLFIPGQGILAILVGLSLLDLPGKRHLERRLIGRPAILRAINAIRARAHRPPVRME